MQLRLQIPANNKTLCTTPVSELPIVITQQVTIFHNHTLRVFLYTTKARMRSVILRTDRLNRVNNCETLHHLNKPQLVKCNSSVPLQQTFTQHKANRISDIK